MGFDLGLQEIYRSCNGYVSQTPFFFPEDAEPEIKYIANSGKQAFSDVLRALPPLNFGADGIPDSPVFLMTPEYHDQPWVLANFALDTPHAHVARYGEQLRQRFAITVNNNVCRIGTSTVTVKDLVSEATCSMRKEVEFHSNGIATGIGEFLEARKDRLLGFFSKLPPESFKVGATFLTSRGSYLMGTYVPQHAAIVVFEVCNDEIRNYCPNFNPTEGGLPTYEWEAEGKAVLMLNSKQQSGGIVTPLRPVAVDPSVIFRDAEKIIEEQIIARAGSSIVKSVGSKQERAITAVTHYFNALHGADKLRALSEATQSHDDRFPNIRDLINIDGGYLKSLREGVTMRKIATHARFNALARLAAQMTPSANLIEDGIIKKVPYVTVKKDAPKTIDEIIASVTNPPYRAPVIARRLASA